MLRRARAVIWKWRYRVYLITLAIAVFVIRSFINTVEAEELHLIPISRRLETSSDTTEEFVEKDFVVSSFMTTSSVRERYHP